MMLPNFSKRMACMKIRIKIVINKATKSLRLDIIKPPQIKTEN